MKQNDAFSREYLLFIHGLTRVSYQTRPQCQNKAHLSFRYPKHISRSIVASCLNSRQLFSVAPMMDVTDKYFRTVARLISKHAILYTEMIVDNVILHSDYKKLERILDSDSVQRPLCLQVGGSDPNKVAKAVNIAHQFFPYDEYNLNCGCPSEKVGSKGCFGAFLMLHPEKVAKITRQVADIIGKPMTVKCRIGVDDQDSYDFLSNFVHIVSTYGHVEHFIVHARSAWLSGLSPKENRSIPPIRYENVYRLTQDFPHLQFTLNGQISTLTDVLMHLSKGVEGAMLGRAVMERPWTSLRLVDSVVYGDLTTLTSRRHIIDKYLEYIEQFEGYTSRYVLVKPILPLFTGEKNCRLFRANCGYFLQQGYAASECIKRSLTVLPEAALDQESWNSEQVKSFEHIRNQWTTIHC